MKILVLGYGASGKAAEVLAKKLGYEVEVRSESLAASGEAADFAVVSPGVPMTSPLVEECRARGIPLKSEMQFGCEELKRRGWRLLAVTGSKGKSSVVKLVAEALERSLGAGAAIPCGNYGRPVSDVAFAASGKWAVVEVSSFMMETTDLPVDFFEAAAILNLQEDHLDRHGSAAVYHALKRKLLAMAKRQVVGEGCTGERSLAGRSAYNDCLAGRSAYNDCLAGRSAYNDCLAGRSAYNDEELFAGSYFDNEVLRDNARCAIELMRAAGLDDAAIRGAFAAFKPLPHRFERVAEIDGVEYIDDSKATSIAALVAGVEIGSDKVDASLLAYNCVEACSNLQTSKHPNHQTSKRLLLIAGGLAKGDDPKIALPILTKRVKKVYLIGSSAEQFSAAWKDSVDCEICGTLEKAVAAAKRDAEKGDKVLLSPGTASFDQFNNFGERGEVFARLVKQGK